MSAVPAIVLDRSKVQIRRRQRVTKVEVSVVTNVGRVDLLVKHAEEAISLMRFLVTRHLCDEVSSVYYVWHSGRGSDHVFHSPQLVGVALAFMLVAWWIAVARYQFTVTHTPQYCHVCFIQL